MSDHEVTQNPDISPRDVHPTKTTGKNYLFQKETGWVSCKQCGFPVKLDRTQPGSGWGNESFEDITTIAGGTANVKDPQVGPGCPMCGTSEYD